MAQQASRDVDVQPPTPPASTEEASYYAPTVMRMPAPLGTDANTLLDEPSPVAMVSHPDLKPFASPAKPPPPTNARTFQPPHDTDPYNTGGPPFPAQESPADPLPEEDEPPHAASFQEMRPPTGILVGFDGEDNLAQAIEEANQRMPTQQDIGLAREMIQAQAVTPIQATPQMPQTSPSEAAEDTTPTTSKMPIYLGVGLVLLLVAVVGAWLAMRSPQNNADPDAGTLANQQPDQRQQATPPERPVIARPQNEPAPVDAGNQEPPERADDTQPPERRAVVKRYKRRRKRRRVRPNQRFPRQQPPDRLVVTRISPPERRETDPRVSIGVIPDKPPKLAIHVQGNTCTLFKQSQNFGKRETYDLTLEAGVHHFRCINRQKNIQWRFQATLRKNKTTVIRKDLTSGKLFLVSNPWSEILLKGFGVLGQSGEPISLPAGRHRLLLRKQGKDDYTKSITVTVQPNQLNRAVVRW